MGRTAAHWVLASTGLAGHSSTLRRWLSSLSLSSPVPSKNPSLASPHLHILLVFISEPFCTSLCQFFISLPHVFLFIQPSVPLLASPFFLGPKSNCESEAHHEVQKINGDNFTLPCFVLLQEDLCGVLGMRGCEGCLFV